MVMIFAALFLMILFVLAIIVLWKQGDWEEYVGSMAAVWVLMVLTVPFVFLLGGLSGLHVYLWAKGMTTFEYIMNKKEAELAKSIKQGTNSEEKKSYNQTEETIFNKKNRVEVEVDEVVFENNMNDEKTSEVCSRKGSEKG